MSLPMVVAIADGDIEGHSGEQFLEVGSDVSPGTTRSDNLRKVEITGSAITVMLSEKGYRRGIMEAMGPIAIEAFREKYPLPAR